MVPNDTSARAAMRVYARLFDQLADLQQRHTASMPGLAREAGKAAFLAMRAHAAEANDPTPRSPRWHDCAECSAYRARRTKSA